MEWLYGLEGEVIRLCSGHFAPALADERLLLLA